MLSSALEGILLWSHRSVIHTVEDGSDEVDGRVDGRVEGALLEVGIAVIVGEGLTVLVGDSEGSWEGIGIVDGSQDLVGPPETDGLTERVGTTDKDGCAEGTAE